MSRKIFRAEGPDVEIVRQQLALNPPDPGTGIEVEYDDEAKATVVWTHAGRRCSVGTAIVIVDE